MAKASGGVVEGMDEVALETLRDAVRGSKLPAIDDVSRVERSAELGPHFVLWVSRGEDTQAFRVSVEAIGDEPGSR